MNKVVKYGIAFVVIGILCTIIPLKLVDNYIYSLKNSSGIEENEIYSNKSIQTSGISLEQGISNLQFSYNNKYYAYIKDDNIVVHDMKTKEVHDTIDEELPVHYFNLLYDKNLMMYFTEQKDGNYTTLKLTTYDVASKRKTEYNKFKVYNFKGIVQIEFSPIINIIYLNIELNNGTNSVYRIDLFNNMSTTISGRSVVTLGMLKHTDKLYYEDKDGNIYYAGGKSYLFGNNKVSIIGTDLNDNIYFVDKTTRKKVYVVSKNKLINTIELSDNDLVNWYSDNTNVYLIFPTYVLNISSDQPHQRVAVLSNYVTFETIKKDVIYLRAQDNIIVTTKIVKGGS